MSIISIILVLIFAFLAGLEGILDQWQFHQPIIACSLIGIATGHMAAGIILGGSLQMIALGWANVGAAVAPDAALASVASAILMVQGGNFDLTHITGVIVPAAILLATAGLVLTTLVRFLSVGIVHLADAAAEKVLTQVLLVGTCSHSFFKVCVLLSLLQSSLLSLLKQ